MLEQNMYCVLHDSRKPLVDISSSAAELVAAMSVLIDAMSKNEISKQVRTIHTACIIVYNTHSLSVMNVQFVEKDTPNSFLKIDVSSLHEKNQY